MPRGSHTPRARVTVSWGRWVGDRGTARRRSRVAAARAKEGVPWLNAARVPCLDDSRVCGIDGLSARQVEIYNRRTGGWAGVRGIPEPGELRLVQNKIHTVGERHECRVGVPRGRLPPEQGPELLGPAQVGHDEIHLSQTFHPPMLASPRPRGNASADTGRITRDAERHALRPGQREQIGASDRLGAAIQVWVSSSGCPRWCWKARYTAREAGESRGLLRTR